MREWFRRFRRPPDFELPGYLRRWYVIPRNRWWNLYLHQILGSDSQDPHDHPAWNISIVLRGSYREHFNDATFRVRRPGSVTLRLARELHRLELIDGAPVWTLWINGAKLRRWGFQTSGGWVPWDEYPMAFDRVHRDPMRE